jgi:hypothetical protein
MKVKNCDNVSTENTPISIVNSSENISANKINIPTLEAG